MLHQFDLQIEFVPRGKLAKKGIRMWHGVRSIL